MQPEIVDVRPDTFSRNRHLLRFSSRSAGRDNVRNPIEILIIHSNSPNLNEQFKCDLAIEHTCSPSKIRVVRKFGKSLFSSQNVNGTSSWRHLKTPFQCWSYSKTYEIIAQIVSKLLGRLIKITSFFWMFP